MSSSPRAGSGARVRPLPGRPGQEGFYQAQGLELRELLRGRKVLTNRAGYDRLLCGQDVCAGRAVQEAPRNAMCTNTRLAAFAGNVRRGSNSMIKNDFVENAPTPSEREMSRIAFRRYASHPHEYWARSRFGGRKTQNLMDCSFEERSEEIVENTGSSPKRGRKRTYESRKRRVFHGFPQPDGLSGFCGASRSARLAQ